MLAPRHCHMVCLDQGRPVYPQDGLYAGVMVPCGIAEMSLGVGMEVEEGIVTAGG